VETFTFLFTGIGGSTALLGRLGEGLYAQVLVGHHALIRSGLAAHDQHEQADRIFMQRAREVNVRIWLICR
jgi:hypothetical protein